MALSPSPQLSPSMGAAQRLDRRSDTPPAQPLSKRDKRRTQLLDRLNEITNQFNNNKDQYYRNQLQAIQVDTGLILHADPYRDDPLNDYGDDVQEMICNATSSNPQAMMALLKGDIGSIAGKIYSEFANDVNDAMETRDMAMTMHQKEHERKLAELHTQNAFMIKLAEEEHKALASTIRDRLINSITGRKIKLNKEKDDLLSIVESNALTMHPNQYTAVNPSSPGGIHGKRATRHRRDVDEVPGFPEGHKRKRKGADDVGSPAPSRRLLENGFSTPVWTAEQIARATNKGSGSPVYSIDKLFTEKELTMTYNTAALAARQYVLLHSTDENENSNNDSDSASNDGDGQKAGEVDQENDANNSPPSAPLMGRQYSHATRSTRGAAGLGNGNFTTSTGIDVISDMLVPSNFARMAAHTPRMPPPISAITSTKGTHSKEPVNSPWPVANDELLLDLQTMERAQRTNESNGMGRSLDLDREMLAAAVSKPGKYQAWLSSEKMDAAAKTALEKGGDGQGGVPMSKQSSLGGSEAGGVPMSRTVTGEGGSSMGVKRRRNG